MRYTSYNDDNPIRRVGSVNWLKYEIKTMTKEFNKRYTAAQKRGEVPPQLEERLKLHLDYGGKANRFSDDVLGYGFGGKRKAELERQYGALRGTLKADRWTDESKELIKDNEYNAWKSFNTNQVVNWSYDKWRKMVDVFGHIDDTILRGFGYEDHSSHNGSGKYKKETATPIGIDKDDNGTISNASLMNAFSKAYDEGVDIFKLLIKITNDPNITSSKGAIDELYKEIKLASGKDSDKKE